MSINVQQPQPYDIVSNTIQIAGVAGGAFEANYNYRISEGRETLWGIAQQYYGNGNLYHRRMTANPSIMNPNTIRVGDVIRVPRAE